MFTKPPAPGLGQFPAVMSLTTLNGANGFELDGVSVGDHSGCSVSAAGDVNHDGITDIIIGAYQANAGAGKTYVVFGKASAWNSPISLSTLNGSNGFELDGVSANDQSGSYISTAGDVNHDGIDDILIGAKGANSRAGKTYVVFGKSSGWVSPISLGTLNGTNGFELDGVSANDFSGSVSAAGDVNHDGIDDILIGAQGANSRAGKTYVVFGKSSGWVSPISLGTLNGTNGFELDGVSANDFSGSVSAAGDVNHDGIADILIGAMAQQTNAGAGKIYVVFGKASGWTSPISVGTLNGANGFEIDGVSAGDISGWSVSAAGDVNHDGIVDILIGAGRANATAGKAYVVFGKASGWTSPISLGTLNGTNGFELDGVPVNDRSSWSERSHYSVSTAGDVNNDGIADIIIGAPEAKAGTGKTYVVFGKASGWTRSISLGALNGANGFRLDGVSAGDYSGSFVRAAGDVNHDGIGDIIIGAHYANFGAGKTYVVFGRSPSFAPSLSEVSSAARTSPAWLLPITQVASLLDSTTTAYQSVSGYLSGSDTFSKPATHNAPYASSSLETMSAQLMLGAVALKLAQKGINWAKSFWSSEPALQPSAKPALSKAEQSLQTPKGSDTVLQSATKDLTADMKHLSEKLETYQASLEETSAQSAEIFYPDFQKPGINFAYSTLARKTTPAIAEQATFTNNSTRPATLGR